MIIKIIEVPAIEKLRCLTENQKAILIGLRVQTVLKFCKPLDNDCYRPDEMDLVSKRVNALCEGQIVFVVHSENLYDAAKEKDTELGDILLSITYPYRPDFVLSQEEVDVD